MYLQLTRGLKTFGSADLFQNDLLPFIYLADQAVKFLCFLVVKSALFYFANMSIPHQAENTSIDVFSA